jgi:hypothetical protein
MSNNGYVYVASLSDAYYKAAIRSAVSLKDHYPDANITLFTHEKFLKDSDRKFFDKVVTNIPVHKRAKMWGMYQTPYDKTLYIDSDTEVRSERISEVFDLLGDNDMMFTKIIPHVSKGQMIDDTNKLEYHGGIILYNNKQHTVDLIKEWYDLYLEQSKIVDWKNSQFGQYIEGMKPWDQFTIWYLLQQERYGDIKHDFFPNGGTEWNYIFLLEENKENNIPYQQLEQIIYHYTIPKGKVDEGNIKFKFRSVGDTN